MEDGSFMSQKPKPGGCMNDTMVVKINNCSESD
jgi:hypothetical protein